MKRIIIFSIFIVTSVLARSQSDTLKCNIDESQVMQGNQNYIMSARDQVILGSGFKFNNSSSYSFTVKTDHTIVPSTPDYLTSSKIITGSSRTLDKTNCVPGTIGGTIDINPTGSATYSIPIAIAPGSHGMQPSLGIVYNSKSGNDILGFGWHLSGLSCISRVNHNKYYDGNYGPVTMSSSDDYELDGQRLICTDGTNLNFSPENDPYTNVKLSGDYFTVTTKDGTVMSYGNSAVYNNNSKFYTIGGTVTLSWGIDRITDPDGNYIQFNYLGNNTTGEYRINEIKYTGNGSLLPYNSINFYYEKRTDVNTIYAAGGALTRTMLLTGIKVFAEGTLAQDYDFSYFYDGLYSKLNQVSLTFDGKTFNPTIINWGTSDYSGYVNDEGNYFGTLHTNQLYFGDFNGDGLNDYVQWNINATSIKVGLALAEGGYATQTLTLPPLNNLSIKDIQVLDWNNDGSDEIMVHYNSQGYDYIYQYSISGYNAAVGLNVLNEYAGSSTNNYYYGDFNGDGIMDRLRVNNGVLVESTLPGYLGGISGIADIRIIDFDGDGQKEFLVLTTDGHGSVWKYSISASQNICIYGSGNTAYFGTPSDLFIGDFNGDGKSDFLSFGHGSYSPSGWNLSYSTGKDLVGGTAPAGLSEYDPSQTGILNGSSYYPATTVFIADLNNDGKDDIIYGLNNNVSIYISIGNSFNLANSFTVGSLSNGSIPAIYLNSAVIYGYGANQKQIVFGNDGTTLHPDFQEISFSPELDNPQYANSFTDGNNINTSITYSPVSTNSSASRNFPLVPIMSMLLPTILKSTDLNSGATISNLHYIFKNGYFHQLGKGFLGFQQFQVIDMLNDYITSTTNFNFTIADGTGNKYYYTWPCNHITQTTAGLILSSNSNFLRAKGGNAAFKLFLPVTTTSIINEPLKGNYSKTDSVITFNSSIGRITDKISIASDGGTTADNNWQTETQYIYATLTGNESVLAQTLSTNKLGGDNKSVTTVYNYGNTSYPFRITSQVMQLHTSNAYNTFDNYGNITSSTVSVTDGTPSRTISCAYDKYGRFITSSTDVINYSTFATYRAIDGAPLSKTDPNGLTTTYSYSSGGNSLITQTTLPDGNIGTTIVAWDGTGTGISTVSKSITNGNTIIDYLNAIGQKLKETTYGFNKIILSSTFTYNTDRTLKTATDNAGNILNYAYKPDDTKRLFTVKGLNTNLQYDYGSCPYTIKVTDFISGQTKTKTFDALGNITAINATTKNVNYTYDASGNLKTISNVSDGGTTSMTYDPLLLTQLSLTDPDGGTKLFKYNGFGQLISQRDVLKQVDTLIYDAYGRLSTVNQTDKNGNTNVTSYAYSVTAGSLGYLNKIIRDNVSETYTYDALCRLSSFKTSGPVIPGSNTATDFVTAGTYNNLGQLASVSYPSGLTVNYSYDAVGNLLKIDNAAGGNIWTGISVNAVNQWTKFSLGNGLLTQKSYDPSTFKLTNIQTGTSGNPTSVQNLGFTFNQAGQLTQRSDGIAQLSEGFNYDPVDRLTRDSLVSSVNTTHVTSYADNGNISNTTWGGTYGYDPSHPHAVNSVSGVANTGQTTPPGFITNCTYNADDKILTIDNGTYHDDFTYGTNGTRFRVDLKTSGNPLRSKVYIYNNEFAYNPSGTNIYKRTIIYAPTGACAVYQDSGNIKTFYYIHTDHLGSWLAITDNTGAVKNRYSYDAWGRQRDPKTWKLLTIDVANALANFNTWQPRFDHGYTGHEQMAGFGLINANGRLYDAYLQRFLSPDNDVQDATNAQNFNRYSYCLNNPLRYTDPSGYDYRAQRENGSAGDDDDDGVGCGDDDDGGSVGNCDDDDDSGNVGNCDDDDSNNGNSGNTTTSNTGTNNSTYNTGEMTYQSTTTTTTTTTLTPITVDGNTIWYTSTNTTTVTITNYTINSIPGITDFQIPNNYNNQMVAPSTPASNTGDNNSDNSCDYSSSSAIVSEYISHSIEGFGDGLESLPGSIRLTNGSYNGSQISIKYYDNAWTGHGTARITTYNTVEWGSRISKGAFIVSAVIGTYGIIDGARQDNWTYGIHAQVATGETAGGMVGGWAGAVAGAEAGAIVGALISSWCGGEGAVPGAIIGGIIGSFGIGWAGSEVGKKSVLQLHRLN